MCLLHNKTALSERTNSNCCYYFDIFVVVCTDQCKLYFMETREMNGKELKVCFNTKVIHNASVYREIFLYRGNGDVV